MLLLYLAAYTSSFLKYVALSTIVGFPTFIMVGISAIVFPYRRRAAYSASVSNISLFWAAAAGLFRRGLGDRPAPSAASCG